MEAIDHRPHAWWLLRQGSDLLLDAHCSNGAVDYPFLMRLDQDEAESYRQSGAAYLGRLAEEIFYSAPGVAGNTTPYQLRNISMELGQEVARVVGMYRSGSSTPENRRR